VGRCSLEREQGGDERGGGLRRWRSLEGVAVHLGCVREGQRCPPQPLFTREAVGEVQLRNLGARHRVVWETFSEFFCVESAPWTRRKG